MNADYIPFWVMRRRPPTSDKGGEINESVFGCRGWQSPPAGGWGSNRDPLPGGHAATTTDPAPYSRGVGVSGMSGHADTNPTPNPILEYWGDRLRRI
jgi:hypothetical protein